MTADRRLGPTLQRRVEDGGDATRALGSALQRLPIAASPSKLRKQVPIVRTHNALAFERRLEDNLCALREELESGNYRPGEFVAFLLEKPTRREIFAADFRDRVMHHVLAGHLEPRWERRFIHDSYACRKRKGTLNRSSAGARSSAR